MAARSRTLREASGRYGAARQSGDPGKIAETHRDLVAEKIAAYIERTVEGAPPLSDDQRARLAALLRATGTAGAA